MDRTLSLLAVLLLLFLAACMPVYVQTPAPRATNVPQNAQVTSASTVGPSQLAEWKLGRVDDMAWSPTGNMFVVEFNTNGKALDSVQMFDVKSHKQLWHADNISPPGLAFSANGRWIALSPYLGNMQLINVENGAIVRQVYSENCNDGTLMLSGPIGNTFFVADRTNGSRYTVDLWDMEASHCRNLVNDYGFLGAFDVNTAGNLVALSVTVMGNYVIVWNETKQIELCRTKGYLGRFVPEQNILAVLVDQKISFIDVSNCKQLRELDINPTFPTYLAFSPDGQLIAIARQSIQILNTSTNQVIAQIPLPADSGPSNNHGGGGGIIFSPDGHYLLLAFSANANDEYSEKVQLWQLKP